jgi:hypothetical protein
MPSLWPFRHLRPCALLAATVSLAGCTTVPKVDYHVMTAGPAHDDWVPFRLSDSVIVLGIPAKSDKDDAGAEHGDGYVPPVSLDVATVDFTDCNLDTGVCAPPDVRIAAVPTGDTSRVLAIEPRSRQLVSTSVAPAYYPDSLRLKVLTIEAKDHKLEAINTIAAIASGVKGLAAGLGLAATQSEPVAPLRLPLTIDLAAARAAHAVNDPAVPEAATAAPLPGNIGVWTYTLTFLDSPPASGFRAAADVTAVHHAMVGSLCRPARLTLTAVKYPKAPITRDVTLADPAWLMTVPFPAKGALVFAPLCGIDVQPQPVTDIGTDAMANAFFNAVNAIRTPAH